MEYVVERVGWIVLIIAGAFVHEGIHYATGYVSGGQPFVSKAYYGIPVEIDYKTPEAMTDRQVRLTAGLVVIFPLLAAVGLWFHWIPLIAFAAGGIGISWLDMLAMQYPQYWKEFTAGEVISRENWE